MQSPSSRAIIFPAAAALRRSWSLPNKFKNRFHSARAKLASAAHLFLPPSNNGRSLTLAAVCVYYIIYTDRCAYGYIIRSIRNQLCVHKPHLMSAEAKGASAAFGHFIVRPSPLGPFCCVVMLPSLDPIIPAHLYTCFHDSTHGWKKISRWCGEKRDRYRCTRDVYAHWKHTVLPNWANWGDARERWGMLSLSWIKSHHWAREDKWKIECLWLVPLAVAWFHAILRGECFV